MFHRCADLRFTTMQVSAAQIVIGLTIPTFAVLSTLACFVGIVALAYFDGCDPLLSAEVRTKDQIVVLMAAKVLGDTVRLAIAI